LVNSIRTVKEGSILKDYKIASVVVTYNRKDLLKKNISCLLEQTTKLDAIYIVDNASNDGTDEVVRSFVSTGMIKYIKLEENLGGSGGFSTGIRQAYSDGYDFIWGMDDDAFPDINALEQIMLAVKALGPENCYWSNCNNDSSFDGEYKEVDSWMFVGFFLPRTVIEKVGFPRDDFFIYHDDIEYAYKIRKKGIKIIKVRDSIIKHSDSPSREFYSRELFSRRITVPKMSSWKFYYYVRNDILRYPFWDPNRYREIFYTLPKMFVKIILTGAPYKKIFLKAYFHGLFNVTGKVINPG